MSKFKLLPSAVVAGALLLSVAAPALAVTISHTNRAGGDPEAASVPRTRGTPPADMSGPSRFDRLHQDSDAR